MVNGKDGITFEKAWKGTDFTMNVEKFYETLDSYFTNNQIEQVDPFLVASLEQAKDEQDYGAYISVCNEMIGFYRSISAFEKAYIAAEDVLLLMEELNMDNTEHFATTLLNAATAYRAAGDYANALRYYRQALQIYDGVLEPQDYRYAGLYNNMSILLEKMEDNEEAIAYAKKALTIIEALPDSGPQTATTMTNLALIYFKVNRFEEAKNLLNKALSLFEQSNGQADEHYSGALAGVAEAWYRMGDYAKALEYYEKALHEIKSHYGENMSYAILCENCAAVCEKMGNIEMKADYIERARKIREHIK